MLGFGLSVPFASVHAGGFSPLALFAANEPGVWYDQSDLSTLFQDSAGTTPVTAVEQPVGLMLDKSRGLVLGTNVVLNGDFSNGLTSWTEQNGGNVGVKDVTVVSGGANFITDGSASALALTQTILTAGRFYSVSFDVTDRVGGSIEVATATTRGPTFNSTGAKSLVLFAADTTLRFFSLAASTNITIDNISVRELPGNHASQSTTTARPVLSARVNLLERTEDFANAYWTKTSLTIASGVSDPSGGSTAFTFTATAANATISRNIGSLAAGSSITCFIRRRTGTGSVALWTGAAYTTIAVTSSWAAVSVTQTTLTTGDFDLRLSVSGDEVDVWHPDVRVVAESSLIPAYQRVTTATDYDTAGFPVYLRAQTDDCLFTGNINFTSTDKMTVFAGVRKINDSTAGILVELSPSTGTNNGAFYVSAPESGATYGVRTRGTANATGYDHATFAAPISNVLAVSLDNAGAGGTPANCVSTRINGVANTAGPVGVNTSAGSFGTYPLFLFRRNNASFGADVRLYGAIVRGAATNAGDISATERWLAAKSGVVL